jgi:O-antigen/teichoic acid export membrane protein
MIPGSVDLIQVIGIEIQRAQNQHKFRGIVYIIMAFINIAMSIPLCIYWGAIGSAVGTAISLILVQGFIINIYLHKKRLVNIVAFWKKILRLSLGILPPLIIGELVIPFFNLTSWSTLLISIICYCTIYVLSMWFIAFDSSQRNWVLKTLKVKSSKSL